MYGNRSRVACPIDLIREIQTACQTVPLLPSGTDQHASVTRILIESGELTQGLVDFEFVKRGFDDLGEIESKSAELMTLTARLFMSTSGQYAYQNYTRELCETVCLSLEDLTSLSQGLPQEIRIKCPEGFAYYCVYPEAYLEAARKFKREFFGPTVVIGLRSIGTSLAAVVAESVGSPESPFTVRPVGHPFQREVRIGAALEERLLSFSQSSAYFILVDVGPGLSGSRFGSVAEWLIKKGIDPSHIGFFPSHPGAPGPREGINRFGVLFPAIPCHLNPFERVQIILQTLLRGRSMSLQKHH